MSDLPDHYYEIEPVAAQDIQEGDEIKCVGGGHQMPCSFDDWREAPYSFYPLAGDYLRRRRVWWPVESADLKPWWDTIRILDARSGDVIVPRVSLMDVKASDLSWQIPNTKTKGTSTIDDRGSRVEVYSKTDPNPDPAATAIANAMGGELSQAEVTRIISALRDAGLIKDAT